MCPILAFAHRNVLPFLVQAPSTQEGVSSAKVPCVVVPGSLAHWTTCPLSCSVTGSYLTSQWNILCRRTYAHIKQFFLETFFKWPASKLAGQPLCEYIRYFWSHIWIACQLPSFGRLFFGWGGQKESHSSQHMVMLLHWHFWPWLKFWVCSIYKSAAQSQSIPINKVAC